MTDEVGREERIKELVEVPPTIERTRWQRSLRVVSILGAVIAYIAFAGVAVGYIRTTTLSTCTNDLLRDRNGVQTTENSATRSIAAEQKVWYADLAEVFTFPPGSAQQRQAVAAFKTETGTLTRMSTSYAQTLDTVQRYREAHPLGKC